MIKFQKGDVLIKNEKFQPVGINTPIKFAMISEISDGKNDKIYGMLFSEDGVKYTDLSPYYVTNKWLEQHWLFPEKEILIENRISRLVYIE